MKLGYKLAAYAVFIGFLATSATASDSENIDLSRGLGSGIKWMTLDDGFKAAKATSKPLFLLIHKTWCGACKNLKPLLAGSKMFEYMSKKFVMVNTLDDEEPMESVYAPDGGYIPRILFFNAEGEFQKDIINEGGNDRYKYFYSNAESVVNSMVRCDDKVSNRPEPSDDDDFYADMNSHEHLKERTDL